jgi:sporulation protein YlmC with PRC-barrel domain
LLESTLDALILEKEAKMLKTLAYATLFSTAVVGSSACAADNPPAPANPPAQTQAPSGVNFVTSQDKSQWRAPKLIGVGVYGSDDKQIGKIDDLLLDKNGSAQTIVIGVGGFLGFGKKDVAVPFSVMQWRPEGSSDRSANPNDRDERTTAAADEGNRSGGHRGQPGLSRQGDPKRDFG